MRDDVGGEEARCLQADVSLEMSNIVIDWFRDQRVSQQDQTVYTQQKRPVDDPETTLDLGIMSDGGDLCLRPPPLVLLTAGEKA